MQSAIEPPTPHVVPRSRVPFDVPRHLNQLVRVQSTRVASRRSQRNLATYHGGAGGGRLDVCLSTRSASTRCPSAPAPLPKPPRLLLGDTLSVFRGRRLRGCFEAGRLAALGTFAAIFAMLALTLAACWAISSSFSRSRLRFFRSPACV